MTNITAAKCMNHPRREAVAKCLECHDFFCRECVVEHGGRMLCNRCLEHLLLPKRSGFGRGKLPWLQLLAAVIALAMVWALFYSLGKMLIRMPDSFHNISVVKTEEQGDVQPGRP